MSPTPSSSPSRRGRSKAKSKAPAAKKGAKRSRGGKARGSRPPRQPRIDPDRPFWANAAGEAEVQAITGTVRPTRDPSALVRSLGSPPIGRFASSAQHYYDAVYEKAQRFAIAMATANGVLLVEGDDDGDPVDGDPAPVTTDG
jgi:hypothetical protein